MNKTTESVTLSTLNLPSPELRRRFSKPLMLCRRWHQCISFLLPFQHIISISFSSFLSDFSLFIPSHLIRHFSLFYLTQWPIRISAFSSTHVLARIKLCFSIIHYFALLSNKNPFQFQLNLCRHLVTYFFFRARSLSRGNNFIVRARQEHIKKRFISPRLSLSSTSTHLRHVRNMSDLITRFA